MKVLQLCPLWYPVSPDSPGGIETFVAQLIPALEELGCSVTLVASGDSRTAADLIPVIPQNLNDKMNAGNAYEYVYYEQHQLQLVLQMANKYDVIHSHLGAGAFLLSALPEIKGRMLHSIHWPLYGDLEWFVSRYSHLWLCTVSEFQARKLRQNGATRCRAIHNGIDVSKFTFNKQGGDELLFIGRMERVKGADVAIRVAKKLNLPLILAGPVIDEGYFDCEVKPKLNHKIRYVGVLTHHQKIDFFGKACCVVLPFKRQEPFGLVAIEAMACGTPVVALGEGAMPEIIQQGVTGYYTRDEGELPSLVQKIKQLDRATIRTESSKLFDITVVAKKYYQLYLEIKRFRNNMKGNRV